MNGTLGLLILLEKDEISKTKLGLLKLREKDLCSSLLDERIDRRQVKQLIDENDVILNSNIHKIEILSVETFY